MTVGCLRRHTSRFLVLWLAFLPFSLWPACGWTSVPASGGYILSQSRLLGGLSPVFHIDHLDLKHLASTAAQILFVPLLDASQSIRLHCSCGGVSEVEVKASFHLPCRNHILPAAWHRGDWGTNRGALWHTANVSLEVLLLISQS